MRNFSVALAVVAIMSIACANAAVLVGYNFQNTLTPTLVAADMTATSVGVGSGLTQNYGGPAANRRMRLRNYGSTFDANDYFEFSLTPDTGYALDIDTVNFLQFTTTSPSGPTTLELRSSLDGFGSTLGTAATTTSPLQPVSFALGPAFDNLVSIITFRIYGYGGTSSAAMLRVDDLVVNGAVVPEPHVYAMAVALGLGGFALWRRRRGA